MHSDRRPATSGTTCHAEPTREAQRAQQPTLGSNNAEGQPYYTAGGAGQWARHVIEGFFRIWDLAKPVIAQVHGYCLAGGSELATACDLVYVADDAQIGYPPVRLRGC
jgi:enoyl-CoA hydratase